MNASLTLSGKPTEPAILKMDRRKQRRGKLQAPSSQARRSHRLAWMKHGGETGTTKGGLNSKHRHPPPKNQQCPGDFLLRRRSQTAATEARSPAPLERHALFQNKLNSLDGDSNLRFAAFWFLVGARRGFAPRGLRPWRDRCVVRIHASL
jgi:hypothetical protein